MVDQRTGECPVPAGIADHQHELRGSLDISETYVRRTGFTGSGASLVFWLPMPRQEDLFDRQALELHIRTKGYWFWHHLPDVEGRLQAAQLKLEQADRAAVERACAPGIELLRIHPVLAAPGTARGFVHGRSGDNGIEPGRRWPRPLASGRGQRLSPPSLQGVSGHAHLPRDLLQRGCVRRQQLGYYLVLECLSVPD